MKRAKERGTVRQPQQTEQQKRDLLITLFSEKMEYLCVSWLSQYLWIHKDNILEVCDGTAKSFHQIDAISLTQEAKIDTFYEVKCGGYKSSRSGVRRKAKKQCDRLIDDIGAKEFDYNYNLIELTRKGALSVPSSMNISRVIVTKMGREIPVHNMSVELLYDRGVRNDLTNDWELYNKRMGIHSK